MPFKGNSIEHSSILFRNANQRIQGILSIDLEKRATMPSPATSRGRTVGVIRGRDYWRIKMEVIGNFNEMKKAMNSGDLLEITIIDNDKGIKMIVHDAQIYHLFEKQSTSTCSAQLEATDASVTMDDSFTPEKVLLT